MTQPPQPLDDADVEALLRGRVPEQRADLAALGTLLSAARETGAVTPAPRGALAALLSEGFDPAAPPAPAADVPAWTPGTGRARPPGLLRRRAAHLAGLSVAVQLVVFGGVAVAGVTTAAGAGKLPEPLQRRVATVISVLTPFTVPAPTPAPAPAPAVTTSKPVQTSEPRVQQSEPEPAPAVVEPAPTLTQAPKPTPTAVPSPKPSPTPTPTEVPPTGEPTTEPTGTTDPTDPTDDPTQQPSGETAAPEEPTPAETAPDDVEAAPGRSGDRGPKVEPATSPEPTAEPTA